MKPKDIYAECLALVDEEGYGTWRGERICDYGSHIAIGGMASVTRWGTYVFRGHVREARKLGLPIGPYRLIRRNEDYYVTENAP